MAAFLYRLGRLAFRRRWVVVAVWVAVLAAVGFASAGAPALPGDDREPAQARVVFVAAEGERVTDAGHRAAIERLVGAVSRASQVAGVASPVVSADAGTAYVTVGYTATAGDLGGAARDQLRAAVEAARAAGLTVEVGGPVLAGKPRVGGPSEVIGVALAALVLLVLFGSVAAAGLPLITALLGVGISTLAVGAVGSAFGLTTTSGILASMLGLAVGIDYALFVVSRYREERAAGRPAGEAAGRAVATAGAAVIFAGCTVVITLAGLTVIGIPMAARMGLTAAGAVVLAVLIALTLVPALLGFWPDAVLARRARTGGARWARFVLRHRVPALLAAVAGLVVLALPVLRLELGAPGDEARSTASTERRAYDALAAGFGPGVNGPLTVVVDGPDSGAVRGIVAGTPGVVSVSPARLDAGGRAVFTAIPSTAPTSEQTRDLVRLLRAQRAPDGVTFQVTGRTAVDLDLAERVPRALVPYLAIVLGLTFLLLLTIFRSPVVPLEAVFGFLLSTLAALGVLVAVFQWGWGAGLIGLERTGPIISTMPIVLVGMIFGLAMDYEVFLVSRIREAHLRGEPAGRAVIAGFRHSARVVAAAALIMIAVFSGFVGADLPMIKMIGFGLATAVLLDAFVVRMTLVPALLALTGELAWWLPRWLSRKTHSGARDDDQLAPVRR